jgi:hypothetical protein
MDANAYIFVVVVCVVAIADITSNFVLNKSLSELLLKVILFLL